MATANPASTYCSPEEFQQGIAMLDGLIEKKLRVEASLNEKAILEARIEFRCEAKVKP